MTSSTERSSRSVSIKRHLESAYSMVGVAVLSCAALVMGCASTSGAVGRHALPPPGDASLVELSASNLELGVDLYRALAADPTIDNIFVSPYSVSAALAMTYVGARGETESEMAEALHFDLPQSTLHPTFAALDQLLESRAGEVYDGEPFQLNTSNALWAYVEYTFLDSFLESARAYYDAEVANLDFVSDPEGARETINGWVAENTQQMIPELLPEGAIHILTRLVLTNTVYFKASWSIAFDEDATEDDDFELLDGSDVQVPMMHGEMGITYADTRDCEVVTIPYAGNQISFVAFVPDSGDFEAFEAELTAEKIGALLAETRHTTANISMPRFETRLGANLSDILIELGMPLAFSDFADFSGMREGGGLKIEAVVHEAVIKLDESGTEAAAATAVLMIPTSSTPPPEPISVQIDRPFIYLIRDAETGAVLFMGRMLDPSN